LADLFFSKGLKSPPPQSDSVQAGVEQPGKAFSSTFEWEQAKCSNGTYTCFAHRKMGSNEEFQVVLIPDTNAHVFLRVERKQTELCTTDLLEDDTVLLGVGVPERGQAWAVVCGKDGANLQVVAAAKIAAKEGGGKQSWPTEEFFWDLVDRATLLLQPKFLSAAKTPAPATLSSGRRSSGPAPLPPDAEQERGNLVEAQNETIARLSEENKTLRNRLKEARLQIKQLERENNDLEAQMQQLSESGSQSVVSGLQQKVAHLEGQVEGLTRALQHPQFSQLEHHDQSHWRHSRRRSRSRSRSSSPRRKEHRRRRGCSCEHCMYGSYD